ncbi:MAG: penicillin acylase family protein [Gammaproteobacteria bacterium]|nr:penicillin acylase family protein [Gammaproteobacteria bacterium]
MFKQKIISVAIILACCAGTAVPADEISLPGLEDLAKVRRDDQGITHIQARNQTDLYYLQGWVHASDRLFQMDLTRRQPSGTLAELFGPPLLPGDIETRTLGLRRAAERSVAVLSKGTINALEAYTRGVNDWVMHGPGLPPEYAAIGWPDREDFRPWNIVDSIVIGKAIAFSLSFDLDTGLTENLAAYLEALGPEGATVFAQDVFRSQPFDCASTVPDATGAFPFAALTGPADAEACPGLPVNAESERDPVPLLRHGAGTPTLAALASAAGERLRRSEFIRNILDADGTLGSNEWGVTEALGANGRPIIANDPHLSLNTPSTFYPIGLAAPGIAVFGSSFPGAPAVVLGRNRYIQWGATTNPMDVTDTFVELLVFDENVQPAATIFQGEMEPVEIVPERFFVNIGTGSLLEIPPNDQTPAATIVVPRRNNGPIIQILGTPAPNAVVPALSIQYTGFSATRELDTFRIWSEARNLDEFREGLALFDFGSQNWIYADVDGNVAYFSSAEMPIRADLNQGTVAPGSLVDFFAPGVPVPPWFIRDGTSGAHEWLPVENPQPGQAIPYEILRQDELPHTINPSEGWFVNANNDPAGTTLDNDPLNQGRLDAPGIYYLNPGYAGGFRAGTITNRVRDYADNQGELSLQDLKNIQADVSLLDARFFVPYILAAYENAQRDDAPQMLAAFAADPGIAEAGARLAGWNFTTPTGIQTGYDAGDPVVTDWAELPEPGQTEVDNSVAATIYSVWRGQAVRRIVDEPLAGLPTPGSTMAMTAMQHLLRTNGGSGVIDFFAVQGLDDAADQRDYKLLASLRAALDLLADDEFSPAFGNSVNQEDYRWGKLHRIVLDHPFIDGASLPAQPADVFPQPVAGLPGYPTDGGFNVVDASSHSARADSFNEFMFGGGPVRRFSGEPRSMSAFLHSRSDADSIWAGGTSGVPGADNPYYGNLLPYWLVNETLPATLQPKGGSGTLFLPSTRPPSASRAKTRE